ncbi:hypothetical protein D9619_012627 [Psilocybe cf. subviscida]|uniref:GST N-terminal domain-containing protein n=1 Tax=Psilocybe cf. subviscida TaxID=2480587 RepID=A0A8H5B6J3_9AGAR|nr:hypothetical protein D9619_012627 [Psilocybe cf. subviscida]
MVSEFMENTVRQGSGRPFIAARFDNDCIHRHTLNYKNIPYKTEWVEYPDIEKRCKELGIRPTTVLPHFTRYTLPAIHDSATNIYMADSAPIAEYLEKQYPDTPTVFPNGTQGLQLFFEDSINIHLEPLYPFILPEVFHILNPISQEFYRRTREKAYKKTLEELVLKGEEAVDAWAKSKAGFSKVAERYAKCQTQGPFLMGDTVSWADFVLSGDLIWYRCALGEDSEKWQEIRTWDGGFWGRFVDAMKKFEQVK